MRDKSEEENIYSDCYSVYNLGYISFVYLEHKK